MKKIITVIWGNPYSLYSLEGLLKKLSEKYEINIILTSIYNAERTKNFFSNKSYIKSFKLIYFDTLADIFSYIKIYNLKKFINESNLILTGDEREPYSKILIHKIINKKIPVLVYWIHSSYFLDHEEFCKNYINNIYSLTFNQKKEKRITKNLTNKIAKLLIIKQGLNLFIKFIYRSIKSRFLRLLKVLQNIIINKFFLSEINFTRLDYVTNVGSGNADYYLFLTDFEVEAFKKFTSNKNIYLTNHPHEFLNFEKVKNNDFIFVSNVFINQDILENEYVEEIMESFIFLRNKYGSSNIKFKIHPRDNGTWYKEVEKKLIKEKFKVEIIPKETTLIEVIRSHNIFVGHLSASTLDIINANNDKKYYIHVRATKKSIKYYDLSFQNKERIYYFEGNKLINNSSYNIFSNPKIQLIELINKITKI